MRSFKLIPAIAFFIFILCSLEMASAAEKKVVSRENIKEVICEGGFGHLCQVSLAHSKKGLFEYSPFRYSDARIDYFFGGTMGNKIKITAMIEERYSSEDSKGRISYSVDFVIGLNQKVRAYKTLFERGINIKGVRHDHDVFYENFFEVLEASTGGRIKLRHSWIATVKPSPSEP